MSLFDDASLVLIPDGAKDGRLYSIRPVEELGNEEVTNGNFSNGTNNWSFGSAFSVVNGKAYYNDSASGNQIYQSGFSFDTSKRYRVSFDISGDGNALIWIGNGSGTNAYTPSSAYYHYKNGHHSLFLNGADIGSSETTLGFWANPSGSSFSIDNISFKEAIVPNGDFTFTRGSNLAATRVDENGLIEKGRENLITYSEDLSDSSWSKNSGEVSVDSNYAIAPDGTLTADKVNFDSSFTRITKTFTVTGNSIYTASFYAKNIDATEVKFVAGAGTSITSVTSYISQLNTSNFTRVSFTFTTNAGVTSITPQFTRDGNIGGSILMWGFQLELGSVETDYIETGATTAQAGILEDLPRIDYSGGASCPALLLEPQRSNLITQSEYFGGYSNYGSTDTANQGISPEGINNATLIQGDGTQPQIYTRSSTITLSSAGAHTFSLFAKKGNNDFMFLELEGFAGSTNSSAYFDLDNGTTPTSGASIEDYGNGWYRCMMTATIDAGDLVGSLVFRPTPSTSTIFYPSSAYANGKNIYIYGAQLEAGSYPTSYIPTYGSSVTRSIDTGSLNLVGAGINDGWTSGTILIEFEKPYNNENTDVIRIHGNSIIGRAYIYNNGYGFATDWSYANNITIGDDTKIIYRLNTLSTGNLFKNGVKLSGAEGSGTAWSDIKYIYLNNQGGAKINIKQIVVFPTALTDSQCIALTTL